MEMLISLKGKIDSSLPESVRKAAADAGKLQQELSKLKGIEANAQKYKALEQAGQGLSTALNKARTDAAKLEAEFKRNQATAAQYKTQLNQARMALAGMSKSANPDAYRMVQQQIAHLRDEYKMASAAAKAAGRDFKQASASVKSADAAYAANRSQVMGLRAALQQAGFQTHDFANSQGHLQQQLRRTEHSLAQAARVQEQYNAQQAQQSQRRRAHTDAQAGFYNATGNLQQGMSVIQTAASPLVGAIQTAASFEQAMAKVKAITQTGLIHEGKVEEANTNMQRLTATARELGEKTQFSASQAAEAMSYLGMAGWKTEQIIGGMPGLLDLAAASGTDLARTADIISDDLTAFGMSADQAGHMADVFAHTITSTNTNVEMLGETMKYAAPVAHLFGASLEETAALAGLMANSGIKASQAGTSLRAGFLRLAGPPKKASKELAAMGVDLDTLYTEQREASEALKSMGIEMENFGEGPGKMGKILTALKEKTADMGQEQKMAALGAIFGTTAVSGWLAVLQSSPEEFNKFVAALEKSDGEAHKMAEIMGQTAQGAMTRFKSAAESAAISVGSVFLPMVADAADCVAKWAGTISQAAAAHPRLIQMLGIVAAAIAGVVMAALTINVAISGWTLLAKTYDLVANSSIFLAAKTKVLTAAQAALKAVMAGNPFALAVIGIAALVSALVYLYKTNENFRKMVIAAWESVSAAAMRVFAPIANFFKVVWATITAIFQYGLSDMASVWKSIDETVRINSFYRKVVNGIIAVVSAVAAVWNGITQPFKVVWAVINTIFTNGIDDMMTIWQSAVSTGANLNLISVLVPIVIAAVKGVMAAWETLTTAMSNGSGEMLLAVAAIATQFYRLQGLSWGSIGKKVAEGIAEAILSLSKLNEAAQGVPNKIGQMKDAVLRNMNSIIDSAKKTGAAYLDMMRNFTISGAIETAKTALKGMGTAIANVGRAAMGAVFSPLGIAIMALAAAAYVLYQNWDVVGPYFMQLWDQICGAFSNAWTIIQPAVMQLVASLQALGAAVGERLMAAWQMLSQVMQENSGAINFLMGILGTLAAFIGGVVVTAILIMANILTTVITTAISIAANAIATFLGVLQGIIDFITGVFTGNWSQAWEGVAQIFTSIFSGIANFAQSILNGIGNTVNGVVSSIKTVMSFGGGNAGVAANAEGGIYRKGAFLTTFAEDSAEAAIPLDGSKRAAGLWSKAGEMLGLLPKGQNGAFKASEKARNISLPPITNVVESLPPIMNMVEALPPEISTIADVMAPPTEAQMAAAPVALEPPSAGGSFEINFNPQITINGNADSNTVAQMSSELSKLKAELMRDLRREFGSMVADFKHNERRTSLAT